MKERTRDLFAVSPDEFVSARNALAKELRDAGHGEEAKEVAALRRPTASVWAVNQLARRSPSELEELLDASQRVEKAQLRGAPGDELRQAMAEQRAALAKLERAAEQVMRGAGIQPSAAALRTVQSTVQAAATGSREMREDLRNGTMREALEPAGFEALLGAGVTPPPKTPAPARKARKGATDSKAAEREAEAAQRAEAKVAAQRARQLEREAKQRARKATQLERRLRSLEAKAEAAEHAAKKARAAADSARAELQRLRT